MSCLKILKKCGYAYDTFIPASNNKK